MPASARPGSPEKKQEYRDAQKVLRLLARVLKVLGFERTKTSFFTRPTELGIQFIHIHKFSFAPAFRMHFGFRVRTDEFPAAHLNGPSSDEIGDPAAPGRRRYNFDFDTTESSWLSCAQAMYACASTEGEEWFSGINNADALLASTSPLTQGARTALRLELENPAAAGVSEATRQALNAA
jgi:hypothetical protein